MEEVDSGTALSASGATSKKASKKSGKHHHNQTPSKAKVRGHHSSGSLPPSIAERPKVCKVACMLHYNIFTLWDTVCHVKVLPFETSLHIVEQYDNLASVSESTVGPC